MSIVRAAPIAIYLDFSNSEKWPDEADIVLYQIRNMLEEKGY